MDKLDNKILLELVKDSRISYLKLAKKCKVSREVINYRVLNLQKQGVITDFYTEIDSNKLNVMSAVLFLKIKSNYENEFIKYINKLDFVSWAGTHSGIWSLGFAIYGDSNLDIEEKLQKILSKYGNVIKEHRFELYKNSKFYYEKYFNENSIKKEIKFEKYSIDDKDKIILKQLSKNSRISSVELSKILDLNAVAISKRIKKMEKSGVILKYSIYLNTQKMNKFLFVYFIENKNIKDRKKLYKYLESHKKIAFLIDYFGDPFIEFGVFVDNPYEVRKIAQEIENEFPENRIVEFFLEQEDFISHGLPDCVFKLENDK